MSFLDMLRTIYKNLSQRKGRTIFTMSGVIIGCLAIFTIVSITNGLEAYLTNSMSGLMDMTTISVYPSYSNNDIGGGSNPEAEKLNTLNQDAVDEISMIPGVVSVSGVKSEYGMVDSKSGNSFIDLYSNDFTEFKQEDVLFGRLPVKEGEILLSYMGAFELCLTKSDLEAGVMFKHEKNPDMEIRFERLIGKTLKFYKEIYNPDGSFSKSSKIKLKVVGIKDYTGSSSAWNNNVFEGDVLKAIKLDATLDKAALKNRLSSNNEIKVKVHPEGDIESDVENITKELRNLGYEAQSPLDFIKETRGMMLAVKLILGFLAGISLLVASFGIINTMEMAIYERNKEIGVMKVLGCSLKDIKKLFMFEACVISGMGGFISIIIGSIINVGINLVGKNVASSMSFEGLDSIASASFGLIFGIMAFSVLIGMFAGYKPSKKAVNIDVLSAIR